MSELTKMEFNKPPVVEVSASIQFDPNESKKEVDLEVITSFLANYKEEYTKREWTFQRQVQMKDVAPDKKPEVLSSINRFQYAEISNKDQVKKFRIGDDKIAFHALKSEDEVPRFSMVKSELNGKLDDYLKYFQPKSVRHTTLRYVDVIEIPAPTSGEIILNDFFECAVELPKQPFGETLAIDFRFVMGDLETEGPLVLRLKSIPTPVESDFMRFRMDWTKKSILLNTNEKDVVWNHIDKAHKQLLDCFRSSITDKTLMLFDPVQ